MCEVPALFLQKGPIMVLLDPVAYDASGAEGVIDLYLMPTNDDMASLYFEQRIWNIHDAFPPDPKCSRRRSGITGRGRRRSMGRSKSPSGKRAAESEKITVRRTSASGGASLFPG